MEDQTNNGQSVEPQIPQRVVINGEEYDPQEASELIGKGKLTREYEQKWNTSVDKVWPEFGRLSTERSQWQTEKQQLQSQLQQFQTKKEAGTETQGDVEKAKEAARKLGLILNEDLEKSGYIKRDDLDKYLSERDAQQEAVKKVLSEADSLEKEINGEDGRPKFNKKVVLAYAQAYGITDLKKAYEDMHSDVLATWKQNQIDSKKPAGLKTLKPTSGNKEPKTIKVDDNNFKDLLRESLYGKEE